MVAMSSDLPDSKSLRKTALAVGFILLGVTVAGVTIPPGATFKTLGIPLQVSRPALLPFVLAMASVYVTFRFVFYTMVLRPSPMRAKSRLRRGGRVDTSTNPRSPEELSDQIIHEANRYFPLVSRYKVRIQVIGCRGGDMTAKVTVPKTVLFLSRLEDLDFILPLIVNVAGIVCWVVMLIL